MYVEDLIWLPGLSLSVGRPEMDPLRESDALQESQLLDVRLHAMSSTVGLLFELRTALQLRDANTAILVARGVRDFVWSAMPRSTARTAWNVVSSEPRLIDQLFVLELDFLPESRLRIAAEHVEFYIGDVDGLDVQPPDYVDEDDATIRANLADWRSLFSPLQAVFMDGKE